MRNKTLGALSGAVFLALILLANYVTTKYGLVPVGFGLMATAGTYLVGLSFILRDLIQDTLGKAVVLGLIASGAGLSFFVSDPTIALASAVAFGLSEVADLLVYTPLRKQKGGYIRAAVASNTVGAMVDTFVFLTLAAPFLRTVIPGFTVSDAALGQVVGKLLCTIPVVFGVLVYRRARRPQPALV